MSNTLIYVPQAVAGAYAIGWLAPKLWFPKGYRPNALKDHEGYRWPWHKRWLTYLHYAVVFMGMTMLAYHLLYALLQWIPYDWGGHNEDGEWEPGIGSARGTIALIIGGCVMAAGLNNEESAALRPLERMTLMTLSEKLQNPAPGRMTSEEYRQSILTTVELALDKEDYRDGVGQHEARNGWRRWFGVPVKP